MSQNTIADFISRWQAEKFQNEKQYTQKFWLELLQDVLGAVNATRVIDFEMPVFLENKSFLDAYIPETNVLIEQKGGKVDLTKPSLQSDGSLLTPYQQAKRYNDALPYSQKARFIVICNFRDIVIYNMEQEKPESTFAALHTKDLYQEKYRNMLDFLIDKTQEDIRKEEDISLQAGELVQKLYSAFANEYQDPKTKTRYQDSDDFKAHATSLQQQSLNILCVRLVFCFYAQKAGLFSSRNAFCDYLKSFSSPQNVRKGLMEVFSVLNTPPKERDPYDTALNTFPYVNGGLFQDKQDFAIEIPSFTKPLLDVIIIDCGSFDWSAISPAIFGAVFESTLNPVNRRKGGMHYTSIENIHKVIDPLFLDGLSKELKDIKAMSGENKKIKAAKELQQKLSSLTFLDPACGSGNFLTETYMSLRRLENEALKIILQGSREFGSEEFSPVKVKIEQFFGLEINDYAVSVAKTALWIAQSQSYKQTSNIMGQDFDFLPITDSSGITECNALTTNWATLQGASENQPLGPLFAQEEGKRLHYDYIFGNPPFVGARVMSKTQKKELFDIFSEITKQTGNLDYVTAWYKKAADLIHGTNTRCAFVSTNSITQGEQVAILWKPLMNQGIHIDFAYRPFRWEHERKTGMAHVHCVVIGFSEAVYEKPLLLFQEGYKKPLPEYEALKEDKLEKTPEQIKEEKEASEKFKVASHINPYLVDAEDVFLENRTKPLCDVPLMRIGNKPIDNGNYLFTKKQMQDFIKKEPASKPYFKRWYGAKEFLNNIERYCLWLGDCPVSVLSSMKKVLKRVQAVQNYRQASKRQGTKKLSQTPTRFSTESFPKNNYMIVAELNTPNRKYMPMAFMPPDCICSNLVRVLPNAALYHFGVLQSSLHYMWCKAVCGRFGNSIRYSIGIVYNNFPWPCCITTEQKENIEEKANKVLITRKAIFDKDPSATFAALYSPLMMPPLLQKAHKELDTAVLKSYGLESDATETEIVSELFRRYKELC